MTNTKDCVEFLIKWTQDNYDSIPKKDWKFLPEKRLKAIEKGHTKASNWKRRAIKKNGTKTYRMFDCSMCLLDYGTQFLVTEENGNLTIEFGDREHFRQYFNRISYNWGWDD